MYHPLHQPVIIERTCFPPGKSFRLENGTPRNTRPTSRTIAGDSLSVGISSHQYALAAGGRLIGVLRLLDLSDEELESLADVLVVAGTGLGPGAVVLLAQLLSVVGADLSLLGPEIALVAHNDDGDPLDTLYIEQCDVSPSVAALI